MNLLAGPVAYAVSGVLFSRLGTGPVLAGTAGGLLLCAVILVLLAVRGIPASAEPPAALASNGGAPEAAGSSAIAQ